MLDLLDGPVARRGAREDRFGAELDSLADLVAFVVAPALLLYQAADAVTPVLVAPASLAFVLAGAWRLARFPLLQCTERFAGLPSPPAGLLLVAAGFALPAGAALAMALPPFQDAALPGAEAAWRLSARGMARPAGGLAPGQEWGESDYSWTPQTALYALAAASLGDDAQAHDRLDWLASHTTLTGSIPEKVGPDGGSAQVAPLIWSTSLVLLTLAELD